MRTNYASLKAEAGCQWRQTPWYRKFGWTGFFVCLPILILLGYLVVAWLTPQQEGPLTSIFGSSVGVVLNVLSPL